MSKREFSKVSPAIWRSKRFIALGSDRGRLLILYYLTSQHQNSAGAYKLPEGYALSDLGWTADEYRAARDELIAQGLIVYDGETEEVFVTGWFKICPPMNDKHAAGTRSRICDIESDDVREVLENEFTDADKARLVGKVKRRGPGNAEFDTDGYDTTR